MAPGGGIGGIGGGTKKRKRSSTPSSSSKLSSSSSSKTSSSSAPPPPSYLAKLSSLRDFVRSMGLPPDVASEEDLSAALRGSGHDVQRALERIVAGSFGGGGGGIGGGVAGGGGGSGGTGGGTDGESRGGGGSGIKRRKLGATTAKANANANANADGSKLGRDEPRGRGEGWILCRRWTVACSKSVRGSLGHGEALDFSENWKRRVVDPALEKDVQGGGGKGSKGARAADPLVRFRSSSGRCEGSLDRTLCAILSPLLRLPARGEGFARPLVSLCATALMEDRDLVMGSDVPLCLEVRLRDPVGFFDLFRCKRREDRASGGGAAGGATMFFRKRSGGGDATPLHRGKKAKSSFSEEELAEAAFCLLQWAERGEELPFRRDEAEDGQVGDKDGPENDGDEDDGDDGDYEEDSPESERVDELNRLVTSSDGGDEPSERPTPELPDPAGFRSGVTLRPYQRRALAWMCRREGRRVGGAGGDDDVDDEDRELRFLAELASSARPGGDGGDRASTEPGPGGGRPAIGCDCGPVVVRDEDRASRTLPAVEDGGGNVAGAEDGERRAPHHPLWHRRFLATPDLGTIRAFYVHELLGIAAGSAPPPPRGCKGGILADAMGLGKTVMLLALILQTKEVEGGDVAAAAAVRSEARGKRSGRKRDVEEGVVELSSDDEDGSASRDADSDDESWTEGRKEVPTAAKDFTRAGGGATLVVAPLSLVSQWEEELSSKTNLSHIVYYDMAKRARPAGGDAFAAVDVVVTTYGKLQSEFASLSRSGGLARDGASAEPGRDRPLLNFRWKRVILDEAHGIKNPRTAVSQACCALEADVRWCVTGTPVQNSLFDVYGLLKFLRHEPWCEPAFWRNAIGGPAPPATSDGAGNGSAMVGGDASASAGREVGSQSEALATSAALGRVRRVLSPIILRRTKDTLDADGRPILTLPPIDSSVVTVSLSPPEREFYNARELNEPSRRLGELDSIHTYLLYSSFNTVLERSQTVFEGFIRAGTATKSWFAIFSLLQRLRQACDHVSLTVGKKLEMDDLATQSKNGLKAAVAEPSSVDSGEVNDIFLNNLLNKFKKKTAVVDEESTFVKHVAESLTQCVQSHDEYLSEECPVCLEEPRVEDAVHTPCAHMFCLKCLFAEFNRQMVCSSKKTKNAGAYTSSKVEGGSCPVCHEWVKASSIIQIGKSENGKMVSKYLNRLPEAEKENKPNITPEEVQRNALARETLESALNGASSSKLEALLAELNNIWELDPGSKILVFSQYLGFLDIVGGAVGKLGVECYRIDGKMTLRERSAMIDKFNKGGTKRKPHSDESVRRGSIFLVSMKAGGVGLNLVAASSVFIMDPWWNQAVEDQCINRIHRIGQQAKVVRVRKFVVADSVEEKMVDLQGKKKGMANEILSDGNSGGHLDSSKPTLEDFKLLFGS
ncbi:hypothetical protein ACHAWF_014931 [Thalassiosira exigua]